jgi:hypothetical protein
MFGSADAIAFLTPMFGADVANRTVDALREAGLPLDGHRLTVWATDIGESCNCTNPHCQV